MGLEKNGAGDYPTVEPTAYIHPTAVLIGNVQVGSGVFVGPQAVIRSDEADRNGAVQPIIIGDDSNVQDCAVIHALAGTEVKIGPRTSIAHSAVIHGPCEIGSDCFVGFGSVVFRATLGPGIIVMHRSLVEGVTIPGGLCVSSMTAVCCEEDVRDLPSATTEEIEFARNVSRTNTMLAETSLNRERIVMQRRS